MNYEYKVVSDVITQNDKKPQLINESHGCCLLVNFKSEGPEFKFWPGHSWIFLFPCRCLNGLDSWPKCSHDSLLCPSSYNLFKYLMSCSTSDKKNYVALNSPKKFDLTE